jgi:hypothetical protein
MAAASRAASSSGEMEGEAKKERKRGDERPRHHRRAATASLYPHLLQ